MSAAEPPEGSLSGHLESEEGCVCFKALHMHTRAYFILRIELGFSVRITSAFYCCVVSPAPVLLQKIFYLKFSPCSRKDLSREEIKSKGSADELGRDLGYHDLLLYSSVTVHSVLAIGSLRVMGFALSARQYFLSRESSPCFTAFFVASVPSGLVT